MFGKHAKDGNKVEQTGAHVADAAVEAHPHPEDHTVDGPYSRPIEALPADGKHDHLAEKKALAESDQEALLDEALEESFPGSDPASPKHIT